MIDSSNVVIPASFSHPWGADAALIDTTNAFLQYTFFPACDYSFSFEVVQILSTGAVAPLPSEITFNSDLTFTVEKCSAATFASDPDCAFKWVDTTWNLVIIARLDDARGTQDASISFSVTIYNDCAKDSI